MNPSRLDRCSAEFPPRLKDIPDPPGQLWIRGDPVRLTRTAVAIVGSRHASPASLDIARRLAADLASAGLAVVSGLARGCDAAAHRGALDAGGVTIAVLGSGVDTIYPPEHRALADEIAARGALVSEFPPGAPPLPGHFRQRNRLISGLAHGVVVIEANERSGSLITAGCALVQGREVMVVPGIVLAGRNRGGHQLIRDGATLVETAEDVLAALVGATPPRPATDVAVEEEIASGGTSPIGGARDVVFEALDEHDAQDLDELVARSGLTPAAVLARLAELELAGAIVRHAAGRFVRSSGKVIT